MNKLHSKDELAQELEREYSELSHGLIAGGMSIDKHREVIRRMCEIEDTLIDMGVWSEDEKLLND